MDDKTPLNDLELNKFASPEPTAEEIIVPLAAAVQAEAPAPRKPLTEAEQREQMEQMRQLIFVAYGDSNRKKLATSRGLITAKGKPTEKLIALGAAKATVDAGHGIAFDPEEDVKPEDLRYFVPLEGDTLRYAVDPKTKQPRLALDKYGFVSMPKGKGRLRRHIGHNENGVKCAALRVFPRIFAEHGGKLLLEAKAAAEKEGKVWTPDAFFGIPEADMPKLYQQATKEGVALWNAKQKRARRAMRRQQAFSRRVNAQHLPSGSVPSPVRFINLPSGPARINFKKAVTNVSSNDKA